MFIEFPKALYKGGVWLLDTEPDSVTVANEKEQAEAMRNGYAPLGAVAPASVESVGSEESALQAQLEAAGVKVDRRWGIDRLKAEAAKV